MAAKRLITVFGATGNQGSEVAKQLCKRPGFQVKVVIRAASQSKPAAQELAQAGATLVDGDVFDPKSVEAALDGAVGCFFAPLPTYDLPKGRTETAVGKAFLDAVKATPSVKHLVLSSVAASEKSTGIAHFDEKYVLEQYAKKELGLPMTVLKPGTFFENFLEDYAKPKFGVFTFPSFPDTKLEMVACEDIGKVAVRAFEEPASFIGKDLELVSEKLDGKEIAAIMSRVTGRSIRYWCPPKIVTKLFFLNKEMYDMFDFFDKVGYGVDVDASRAVMRDPISLEDWLKKKGYA